MIPPLFNTAILTKQRLCEVMTAPHRRLVWLNITETEVCCWFFNWTVRDRFMFKWEDNQQRNLSLKHAGQQIKHEVWGNLHFITKITIILSSCLLWCESWRRQTGWGKKATERYEAPFISLRCDGTPDLTGSFTQDVRRFTTESLQPLHDRLWVPDACWHILQLDWWCEYTVLISCKCLSIKHKYIILSVILSPCCVTADLTLARPNSSIETFDKAE